MKLLSVLTLVGAIGFAAAQASAPAGGSTLQQYSEDNPNGGHGHLVSRQMPKKKTPKLLGRRQTLPPGQQYPKTPGGGHGGHILADRQAPLPPTGGLPMPKGPKHPKGPKAVRRQTSPGQGKGGHGHIVSRQAPTPKMPKRPKAARRA